jgi:hypothetical protein
MIYQIISVAMLNREMAAQGLTLVAKQFLIVKSALAQASWPLQPCSHALPHCPKVGPPNTNRRPNTDQMWL